MKARKLHSKKTRKTRIRDIRTKVIKVSRTKLSKSNELLVRRWLFEHQVKVNGSVIRFNKKENNVIIRFSDNKI